jgi:cytidylate kinase
VTIAQGLPPLTVIHVNGPINSGKSTVGRALARVLPDAGFVEGDDHGAPEDLPAPAQWAMAVERIAREIAAARSRYLVVAYPLAQADFEQLRAACERRAARLVVVTLSLPLEVALSDRGERKLSPRERTRIVEMYEEGYPSRSFSHIVLNTARMSPEECADDIARQVREAD